MKIKRPASMAGVAAAGALLAAAFCTPANMALASDGALATPHDRFGLLYEAVQAAQIFPDAKTFADAVPKADPKAVIAAYESEKPQGDAALRGFVDRHFILPTQIKTTLRQHIASLWPILTRGPDVAPGWSSAIPLPVPYVVPGGRFREIYYWDSYFTMLGLRADGRHDLGASMLADFNSLLYQLEAEIARRCRIAEDEGCANTFRRASETRANGVRKYFWNSVEKRFADYDVRANAHTPVRSAATFYPLWVGIATRQQARTVAETARLHLLAPGGLRTTRITTGQQWDAPNGWAPLQSIAIDGLARYGQQELARKIARRWIATVSHTWGETGKMLEKYDVEELKPGGGGEYETQDGFGWTNGVTATVL